MKSSFKKQDKIFFQRNKNLKCIPPKDPTKDTSKGWTSRRKEIYQEGKFC